MDLRTFLRIMGRRWYAVAAVLLVTIAVTGLVLRSIEPEYEAEGSVLLLGPSERIVPDSDSEVDEFEQRNPYVEFNRSLQTTSLVIGQALTDGRAADALLEQGYTEDFTVEVSEDGPILEIRAVDPEPNRAVETVGALFDAVSDELRIRQDAVEAPDFLRIRSEVLIAPTDAAELTLDRNRAVAAIVVLGLAAAVGAALAVDRLATRRRDRRAAGDASSRGADRPLREAPGGPGGEPVPARREIPAGR